MSCTPGTISPRSRKFRPLSGSATICASPTTWRIALSCVSTQRHLRGHLHRLLHGAQLETELDPLVLVDRQGDAVVLHLLESRDLRCEVVRARRQQRRVVVARLVGHRRSGETGRRVGDEDGDAGKRRAGRIGDRALEASGGALREPLPAARSRATVMAAARTRMAFMGVLLKTARKFAPEIKEAATRATRLFFFARKSPGFRPGGGILRSEGSGDETAGLCGSRRCVRRSPARCKPPRAPSTTASPKIAVSHAADTRSAESLNALLNQYCLGCHDADGRPAVCRSRISTRRTPMPAREIAEKMIREAARRHDAAAGRAAPRCGAAPRARSVAREAASIAAAAAHPFPAAPVSPAEPRRVRATPSSDLLGARYRRRAFLPPDTMSDGFDNIADVPRSRRR